MNLAERRIGGNIVVTIKHSNLSPHIFQLHTPSPIK